MAKRSDSSGFTRGQSRRLRREAEMQRIVVISTALVGLIVVGLIGYAVVNEYIIKPNRVIVQVNGEKVTGTEFTNLVKFSYYRSFGAQPPEAVGLDANYIGQLIYDGMINDILLEQKAAEMAIEVTDAEVEEEIQLSFGYDAGEPEPTTTVLPTSDIPTGTPTLTPTYVYTQTPFPTPTLEPGITPSPTVELTPTSDAPTPTFEPTQAPLPTFTPEPVTEASYQEELNTFISDMSTATGMSEETIRQIWRDQTRLTLLRQKMLDALDLQVDKTKTRIHAAHILVESEEAAQAVLDRLNNGEDFAVVAAEVSRDDSNAYKGGDLGWFGRGRMVAAFEDAAFALEPGQISQPVQTEFGWHIIKVFDKVEEPLTDSEILQAQQAQFQDIVDQWRAEADLVIDDNWQEFIPTELP
jgi:parvulin-like peptidyl-prolyl isomerase